MNPLILSALILLPIAGFIVGAYFGSRTGMVYRIRMFQDLDHLIGMINSITLITHDRRIAKSVVIDELNEMKYGLRLPTWVERQWDEHPPDSLDSQGQVR